jgi:hypothetical protein
MHKIPPHFAHFHLIFSAPTKRARPISLIARRFSKRFTPYFSLYLLFKDFNRLHGKESHNPQKARAPSFFSHCLTLHVVQYAGLFSVPLHPGQVFFFL